MLRVLCGTVGTLVGLWVPRAFGAVALGALVGERGGSASQAHPELLEPLHGAREALHAHVLVEVQRAEDGGEARRRSEVLRGVLGAPRRSLRLPGVLGLPRLHKAALCCAFVHARQVRHCLGIAARLVCSFIPCAAFSLSRT